MSTDYDSVAGYGVKVKSNLTKEGVRVLEEECGECIEEFIGKLTGEFEYEAIGNHFSEDVDYVILVEDPLNSDGRYDKLKETLKQNTHLLANVEPEWINEICVW